ncbi:hypothetical protein [Brunnivagina elsteri]|uniref:Uncharacterized protein n=1 Tax=Brunnivagina elsteri CCALA 953 TaxID=987040 RepID=A0A2A2TK01_9CYAN|nr:hypothetical protein [Calothrix elsteri]PAX55873.1 hypothetical protein CK510_10860 [Calothrix elsteri CCALA 953]
MIIYDLNYLQEATEALMIQGGEISLYSQSFIQTITPDGNIRKTELISSYYSPKDGTETPVTVIPMSSESYPFKDIYLNLIMF